METKRQVALLLHVSVPGHTQTHRLGDTSRSSSSQVGVCLNLILLVWILYSLWEGKKTTQFLTISYLPLVGWTDVQVTQDGLRSDFVVHPLISRAVVGRSEWRKKIGDAVREHGWHLAETNKINNEILVGRRATPAGYFGFSFSPRNHEKE